MVQPFRQSRLGGNIGVRNCTIYRLTPSGSTAIETLLELVNPFSPDKVAMDLVESETRNASYSTTDNPLQDFTSATSNIHKELETMEVSGIFISSIDIPFVGSVGVPGIPGGFGGGLRADLLKLENLRSIAAEKRPVCVVTPRRSMPRAWITSISGTWDTDMGENTGVSISFKECRIVSPMQALGVVPDVASLSTGNVSPQSIGGQAPQAITTQSVQASGTVGVPPTVIGA